MLRLRAFGALELVGDDGRPLQAILSQPKRAALLCYLAFGGPGRFRRRDTILALFWPELDEHRARNALNTATSYLRRSLGRDVLVRRGDAELGLAPERIWSDVAAFQEALRVGRPIDALELYRGDLVPGLSVAGAPEVEEWIDGTRGRLRRQVVDAARRLAAEAETKEDLATAAEYAGRAVALAPLEERSVQQLMRLLVKAGDRASALTAFEEFRHRLAQDLEAAPSPETVGLARKLRVTEAPRTPPSHSIGPTAPAASADDRAPAALPDAAVGDDGGKDRQTPAPSTSPSAPLRRPPLPRLLAAPWFRWTATVGALVLAAAVVSRRHSEALGAEPAATRVAVLPFQYAGPDRFSYLAEGMADLVSVKLDLPGVLSAVDPHALMAYERGLSRPQADLETGRQVASRFSADAFVLGSVVAAGDGLEISAGLYLPDGTRIAQAEAAIDREEDVFRATDGIARQLTADRLGGAADRLSRAAALTTASLPALKAYLEGERELRAGRYASAAEAFRQAVAEDSTFALAYYRYGLARLWADLPGAAPIDGEAAALHHAERLSDRYHRLLDVYGAWLRGDAAQAEDLGLKLVSAYPDAAEAWYLLGETLFHYNPLRGRPIAEARHAFLEVVHVDPGNVQAMWHLAWLAAYDGRTDDFDRWTGKLAGISPAIEDSLELRTMSAFAHGDRKAEDRLGPQLRRASETTLTRIVWRVAVYLHDIDGARRVAGYLLAPDRSDYARLVGHREIAFLDWAGGRWQEARAHVGAEPALDVFGGISVEDHVLLATSPFARQAGADLEDARRAVSLWPRTRVPGGDSSGLHLRELHAAYYRGIIDVEEADTASARDEVRMMDSLASAHAVDPVRARSLADAVGGGIATLQHRADDAVALLEGTTVPRWFGLALSSPRQSRARERFERAEALAAVGRGREALPWFASLAESSAHDLIYLAPAELDEARIYERLGKRDAAAIHYRRFIDLWKNADAPLQPLVEQARRRLREIERS